MSNYSELMNNSELSLASYSNLTAGNISAILLRDMAACEKDNFVSRFDEVVAVQPNTDSGFSATAFKSYDGQLTVAIRGTEGVNGNDTYDLADGNVLTNLDAVVITHDTDGGTISLLQGVTFHHVSAASAEAGLY